MPTLTRRRVPEAPNETCRVFYADVPVGTTSIRAGVPGDANGLPIVTIIVTFYYYVERRSLSAFAVRAPPLLDTSTSIATPPLRKRYGTGGPPLPNA